MPQPVAIHQTGPPKGGWAKRKRKERDRRGQRMTDGRPRHGAGGGAKHHLITAHRTTTGPIPQEEGRKKRKVGRQHTCAQVVPGSGPPPKWPKNAIKLENRGGQFSVP